MTKAAISMWIKSKVFKGLGLAQKLGFPTVNLEPGLWPDSYKEGVYACLVSYKEKLYKGALYFGPRLVLKEKNNVLEIHIIDFNRDIVGETLEFKPQKYLRKPKNFTDLSTLKKQLRKDVKTAKKLLK